MEDQKDQPHQPTEVSKTNYSQSQEIPQNFSSKMSGTVTDWAGVERLEGFN